MPVKRILIGSRGRDVTLKKQQFHCANYSLEIYLHFLTIQAQMLKTDLGLQDCSYSKARTIKFSSSKSHHQVRMLIVFLVTLAM